MALGGSVGGLLGWRVLRARAGHSLYDDSPIGMSREQYDRRRRWIARFKTVFRAVLCALAGVLLGWAVASLWH